ncbi:MAG TPA: hypothetical protein VHK86_02975 [Nitrososphaera sp.]|nr:hypothetical protein [Nitrososphaera sp.]HEX2614380.1 hypothetical protein [Nitrososphaera sp.]
MFTGSYTQVAKYSALRSQSTNIFLIASIVFLTVGSGYLAKAWMHYSEASADDTLGRDAATCNGCFAGDNNDTVNSYVKSFQGKMQKSLQDMILNAGIGATLFSMGTGFSMVYFKWFRNTR